MLSAFLCSLWNTRMYIPIDSCGWRFEMFARNLMRTFKYCANIFLRISRAAAVEKNVYKFMECPNTEWSSTRRESEHCLRYFYYIQDWPQKILESETSLIFQASTPKSKMKPCMILKSTGAIVIHYTFPRTSRATFLFRRLSHYIRYNLCIWRRYERWFRGWSSDPASSLSPPVETILNRILLQLNEFRLVTAVVVWN